MGIHVNLELTDHCNIRCGMCSQSMRDDAHGGPKRFMEFSTWKSALHGLADFDEDVHLCPHWLGEPTIHPEFDKFIEYAFAINADNRLFREFKLHTNAVVFSAERARLLIRLANAPGHATDTFRFVHFSLDALTAPTYAVVKGADRGEIVRKNVERFVSIREMLGADWPKVTMAFVVQPDNAHEAHAFLQHWRGVLHHHGRRVAVTSDWPDRLMDTIYFRPLNTGDQAASDRLHAQTCQSLGIATGDGERLRAAESF